MIMESGNFNLNGTDVAFNPMPADKGVYVLTGYPATHAYAGSYTITAPAIGMDIRVLVDSSSYTWTGFPATHLYPGSFVISGETYWGDPLTNLIARLNNESEPFNLSGTDVTFNRMSPASGSYLLSGDVGFSMGVKVAPSGDLVYLCTLTGSPDLELKMKSFQAIKKTGEPTYLQIVIPGVEYENQIYIRSTGKLIIEMGYRIKGIVTNKATILETDLEDIDVYKGPNRRSIILTGYGTTVYPNNTVRIEGPSYKNTLNGYIRYRFPSPNLYVQPGDTVIIDSDKFKAHVISYFVSASYSTMELAEVM